MGGTASNAKRKRATVLAVLMEQGPITDSHGFATAKLKEWVELNTGPITQAHVISIIKEFGGHIQRQINGKRCYSIALADIPSDWVADVEALAPELKWEASAELEPPSPNLEPEVRVERVQQPTADEVADAILRRVLEVYTRADEPTQQQKLREAWDQLEAARKKLTDLQDAYQRQSASLEQANRRIGQLEAANSRLEMNLKAAIKDRGSIIDGEVAKRLDGIIRQAPGSMKSRD